jgi:N-acetylglutamate synthase-like GNAT family acetyltransferase
MPPVARTAGTASRMDVRKVNGSNRSILITPCQKEPVLARDMNHVTIRNARKSDLQAINQLIFQLISTLDKKEDIDPEFLSRNSRNLLRSAHSHFLVAEDGKTVVGFAHFTTRGTMTHRGLSGLIDELVVAKGFREAGIGRRLLLACVQRCRGLGCCEVEVSTERTNKSARAFYRSCGFEERGVLLERDLA